MSAVLPSRQIRWGLTGGIGSGKSTVGHWLEGRGAEVLDADLVARACTERQGAAMPAIVAAFGAEFVDHTGAMNRSRMREHVFAHPEAKQLLESIVHPCVAETLEQKARQSKARLLVFDIPLLVESTRWRPQLDRILVVDCDRETQARRVINRSGWSRALVDSIIEQQSTRRSRLAAADLVIYNHHDSLKALHQQLDDCAHWFGL